MKQARQQSGCAKQDLTSSFSTDESPVFKSSKNSTWPIHVMLNELSPSSSGTTSCLVESGLARNSQTCYPFLRGLWNNFAESAQSSGFATKCTGSRIPSLSCVLHRGCSCQSSGAKPQAVQRLQRPPIVLPQVNPGLF